MLKPLQTYVIRITPRITMYILKFNCLITSKCFPFFKMGHVHEKNLFRKPASERNPSYIIYTVFGFFTLVLITFRFVTHFPLLPFCSRTFYSVSSLLVYVSNCFLFVYVSHLVIPVYSLQFSASSRFFA
jgi:hypothetical protein